MAEAESEVFQSLLKPLTSTTPLVAGNGAQT